MIHARLTFLFVPDYHRAAHSSAGLRKLSSRGDIRMRCRFRLLVVDTVGFNDKSWIGDTLPALFPHTEMLHLTSRLRRTDLGHLQMDVTFEDPGAFAKPWILKTVSDLAQGEEVQEWICNENNQDPDHLVGK
jgi:hypothetical protein